jgi:hypothetical protein
LEGNIARAEELSDPLRVTDPLRAGPLLVTTNCVGLATPGNKPACSWLGLHDCVEL